jgi:hypothetical protein
MKIPISQEVLLGIYSIDPHVCSVLMSDRPDVDITDLLFIFEATGDFSIFQILCERDHRFEESELIEFASSLRTVDELLSFIQLRGSDVDLLDLFARDSFSPVFRTGEVASKIISTYREKQSELRHFLEILSFEPTAEHPSLGFRFESVLLLIAESLADLSCIGNPDIENLFAQLLFSRKTELTGPLVESFHHARKPIDIFRQLLAHSSPTFLTNFLILMGPVFAWCIIFPAVPAPLKVALKSLGVTQAPRYLCLVVEFPLFRMDEIVEVSDASYRFIGAVMDNGQLTRDLNWKNPAVFMVLRRTDVFVDEVAKLAPYRLSVVPSICYALRNSTIECDNWRDSGDLDGSDLRCAFDLPF